MTAGEFNKLTINKKADFVLTWGFFVGEKQKNNCTTRVYYLGNFIAELCYQSDETTKTKRLESVDLKKYLSQFDYKNIFFTTTLTGIQSNIPS